MDANDPPTSSENSNPSPSETIDLSHYLHSGPDGESSDRSSDSSGGSSSVGVSGEPKGTEETSRRTRRNS
jgi:hypothetical protein